MSFDRRHYAREWRRRKFARELAARNASAVRCQRKSGRFGICDGSLVITTDGQGRTITVCERCERLRRGICRDCGRRVVGTVGRSPRCAEHTREAAARAMARYRDRNRKALRAKAVAYYEDDAAKRAARNAYKRLWRQANPEKVRGQKRRESLRQTAARRKYHNAYRARHRRPAYGETLRTCLTPGCEIVVTHRKKKCSKCRARDQQTAARLLAQLATPRRRRAA